MTHPQTPPASALLEGAQRYRPRFLAELGTDDTVLLGGSIQLNADVPNAAEDLGWLLDYSSARGQRVCLV
jgi:hypothetical protein